MWHKISDVPVPKDGKEYICMYWDENTWMKEDSDRRWQILIGKVSWSERLDEYVVLGIYSNIAKYSHWCSPPENDKIKKQ